MSILEEHDRANRLQAIGKQHKQRPVVMALLHAVVACLHLTALVYCASVHDTDISNTFYVSECPPLSILRDALHIHKATLCTKDIEKGYPLIVIACFLAIAAVSEITQAIGYTALGNHTLPKYIDEVGPNIVRWIEYTITVPLMSWVLLPIVGSGDFTANLLGAAACAGWMSYGFIFELKALYDTPAIHYIFVSGAGVFASYCLYTASVMDSYYRSINNARRDMEPGQAPPKSIDAIAYSIFVCYTSFFIVQVIFTLSEKLRNNVFQRELAYSLLSVLSKQLLAWLFIGAVTIELD
jgi:hypothetical protein